MSKVNFKDKHLRYGGYGALLTLLVITITIVVNLIFTTLDLKLDFTEEKIYSLSDSTKNVVESVQEPINIYVLEQTGNETDWLQEIITKYTKLNEKLTLEYKDPVLYPTFGNSYLEKTTQNISSIAESTIIVENTTTGKFKIIPPNEILSRNNSSTSITVENALTNAIGYVMNDHDGKVYYTTGHNESTLSPALNECFERANLSSESINLLTDEMPTSEEAALIIYSPHSDFTEEEVNKVIDFLSAGGKGMFFLDCDMPDLPEFNKLLNYYGISTQAGIAIENNSNNRISTSPAILIPSREEHDIISQLTTNTSPILVPFACGLEKLENPRSSLTVTPLLSTSNDSFIKKDINASSLSKAEGDLDGPIILSCAIEDHASKADTKLFVMANTYFLDTGSLDVSATGNEAYINSVLGWLLSIDTNYAIAPKTPDTYTIKTLSTVQTLLIELVVIIIIPLIIIISGIIVWVKRRHL